MKRCFEFCLSLMSFAVAMTAVGGETNALAAAGIFLECESFDRLGGWTVETQSMRQLGSSYVMAHGYGRSVEDAVTTSPIGPVTASATVSRASRSSSSMRMARRSGSSIHPTASARFPV